MKKKILILGATGMAGHVVHAFFKEKVDYCVSNIVFRTPLNDDSIIVDVNDRDQLESTIFTINPDYIINCIGVLIKGANENPANAIYINSFLPHLLSSFARKLNAKLIHISTDCVFSGNHGSYSESSFRDADNVYGRTKALGELDNKHDLTIRTSIIGPELKEKGEGLFHWFMHQKNEINGFTKAFWSGITTIELAKVIYACMQQNTTGIINITNGEKICKHNLICLFRDIFKRSDIIINEVEGKLVDKSLISKRDDFTYKVMSYQVMIEEMHDHMLRNLDFYSSNYPSIK